MCLALRTSAKGLDSDDIFQLQDVIILQLGILSC